MDTTTAPPPPPPAPAPPTRLRRSRDGDDVWLGVCAGLGRATGTDPVLWRVSLAVLTVFGGTGLLLYGAAWLLLPEQGSDESVLDRFLRRRRSTTAGTVVVLGLVAVAALGITDREGRGLAPLVVVGLLVYLVSRRTTQPRPDAAPGAVAADPGGTATTAVLRTAPAEPPPPAGPPVTLVTVVAAALVGVVLLALDAAGVGGLTVGRVLGAVLAVVLVGLVVALRWRRGWALAALALAVAAPLALVVQTAFPVEVSSGERTWVLTGSGERDLGAGEAVLDLRGVTGPAEVEARLGAGRLEVLLPEGVRVELDAAVQGGEVLLPGTPAEAGDGWEVDVDGSYGPADGPLLRLDLAVGYGQVVVREG